MADWFYLSCQGCLYKSKQVLLLIACLKPLDIAVICVFIRLAWSRKSSLDWMVLPGRHPMHTGRLRAGFLTLFYGLPCMGICLNTAPNARSTLHKLLHRLHIRFNWILCTYDLIGSSILDLMSIYTLFRHDSDLWWGRSAWPHYAIVYGKKT